MEEEGIEEEGKCCSHSLQQSNSTAVLRAVKEHPNTQINKRRYSENTMETLTLICFHNFNYATPGDKVPNS